MQGRNHVALALAVPLGAAMLAGPEVLPESAVAWGGLVIGSLAPDLDGEGAIAYWGDLPPRRITPKAAVTVLNWLGVAVSRGIRGVFGHRKALHWPIWGVLLALAGLQTGYYDWLVWLGIGYVLHIAGDALTRSGVPLLGPFIKTDISFTPMVTGKRVESAFGLVLWLFVAWQLAEMVLPSSAWLWQQLIRFGSSVLFSYLAEIRPHLKPIVPPR